AQRRHSSSSRGGSPPLRPENIVHHTMSSSTTSAPSASSTISSMGIRFWLLAAIVGMLAACGSVPLPRAPATAPITVAPAVRGTPAAPEDGVPLGPALLQGRSRWTPARWSDLPGFGDDALHEAWGA